MWKIVFFFKGLTLGFKKKKKKKKKERKTHVRKKKL